MYGRGTGPIPCDALGPKLRQASSPDTGACTQTLLWSSVACLSDSPVTLSACMISRISFESALPASICSIHCPMSLSTLLRRPRRCGSSMPESPRASHINFCTPHRMPSSLILVLISLEQSRHGQGKSVKKRSSTTDRTAPHAGSVNRRQ